jgi:hypothetical protein
MFFCFTIERSAVERSAVCESGWPSCQKKVPLFKLIAQDGDEYENQALRCIPTDAHCRRRRMDDGTTAWFEGCTAKAERAM